MIENPVKEVLLKDLKNNSPVRISDLENRVNINLGPAVSFQEMTAKRKPFDANEMRKQLYSQEGHSFANFGVSTVLTIEFDRQDYLIFEDMKRKDRPNILKHVSGYVEAEFASTPGIAAVKEINEEFLPITNDGNHLKVLKSGMDISEGFGDKLDYESRILIIEGDAHFDFYGLQRDIFIGGQSVGLNPRITYHTETDNAQILYQGHIDVPDEIRRDLNRFNHSTDKLNSKTKKLETHYTEEGILLALVMDRKLTGNLYRFEEGKCVQIPTEDRFLSDAFAPYEDGLIVGVEANFEDYVRNQ